MKKWLGLILIISVLIFGGVRLYTAKSRPVKITTNKVSGHYGQATSGLIQVILSKPQVEKTPLKTGTIYNMKIAYKARLAKNEHAKQSINLSKAIRVQTADKIQLADEMHPTMLSDKHRSATGGVTIPLTIQSGYTEADVLDFKVSLVTRPSRNVKTIVNY